MIDKVSLQPAALPPTTPVASPNMAPQVRAATAGDFSSAMSAAAQSVARTLVDAEVASIKGVNNQLPIRDVVEAVMQAEQSLQAAIAVRDKVVAAYMEISRMQI